MFCKSISTSQVKDAPNTCYPSKKTLSGGATLIACVVGSVLVGIGLLHLKGTGAIATLTTGGLLLTGAGSSFIYFLALSCCKKRAQSTLVTPKKAKIKTEEKKAPSTTEAPEAAKKSEPKPVAKKKQVKQQPPAAEPIKPPSEAPQSTKLKKISKPKASLETPAITSSQTVKKKKKGEETPHSQNLKENKSGSQNISSDTKITVEPITPPFESSKSTKSKEISISKDSLETLAITPSQTVEEKKKEEETPHSQSFKEDKSGSQNISSDPMITVSTTELEPVSKLEPALAFYVRLFEEQVEEAKKELPNGWNSVSQKSKVLSSFSIKQKFLKDDCAKDFVEINKSHLSKALKELETKALDYLKKKRVIMDYTINFEAGSITITIGHGIERNFLEFYKDKIKNKKNSGFVEIIITESEIKNWCSLFNNEFTLKLNIQTTLPYIYAALISLEASQEVKHYEYKSGVINIEFKV